MELIQKINDYLEKKEDKNRDDNKFHISELGLGTKFLFDKFKNKKLVDKPGPQLKRIFDNGRYMHDRYYKYFLEMGILRAVEIQAVDNELFTGTADCIIAEKDGVPWLLDLKSCNSWVFKKLDYMKPEHKVQILFYMYYLNIQQGMVLYENKDDQTIKIFKIFLNEENRIIVERLIEEFKQLKKDIDNRKEEVIEEENIVQDVPLKLEDLQYGN